MELPGEPIIGECLWMCPEEEIELRKRERLIHCLERPPNYNGKPHLDYDPSLMVKSYSRSAAGKMLVSAKNLRPYPILENTVEYLIKEIIPREDVPWIVIYEFVMDRFDAVRQDIVIQNIGGIDYIRLMIPIVQVHAYAGYKLCENNKFDAHINKRHLLEALKGLLSMYDYVESESYARDNVFIEYRMFFETMYVLLNLGDPEATTRGLNVNLKYKTRLLRQALESSLHSLRHNYLQIMRTVHIFPPLLQALISLHLPDLRKNLFKVMNVAFSSNVLSFPVEHLQKLMLYETIGDLISDCEYYRLKLNGEGVKFLKGTFDKDKQILRPKRLNMIDRKLDDFYISDLLLTVSY